MTTWLTAMLIAGLVLWNSYQQLHYADHHKLKLDAEYYKKLYNGTVDSYYKNLKDYYTDLDLLQRQHYKLSMQLHGLRDSIKPATILEDVYVTAYAPMDNQSGMCADETPTTTSTGVHPGWGYVAVNPDLIPYGTVLYIPDYGTAIAVDTGYAVRNYNGIQIDVYMDTYDQAIQWGARLRDVIVIDTLKKEEWVGLRLIKEEANE